ncbi:MAG TPA: ABC transporter permease [Candidatus Eremiobacteraceae bacterium]|nr:ABC transporter permease [Candidatus Eremiobacteraceae bacterium]
MPPVSFATFISAHRADIIAAIQTHAGLSGAALAIAVLAGVPLGLWCAHDRRAASAVVTFAGAARVVPSLAVLTLMLPILGLGFRPALVALTLLALPPIIINTYVGFRDVDPSITEAAKAMGMSAATIVRRVESPLAFPVAMTGVRTAAVEVIASATLATFIGGGGLGDLINNGLQLDDSTMLLTGAALVALMALVAEIVLGGIARLARAA